jgi:hypothetical protein
MNSVRLAPVERPGKADPDRLRGKAQGGRYSLHRSDKADYRFRLPVLSGEEDEAEVPVAHIFDATKAGHIHFRRGKRLAQRYRGGVRHAAPQTVFALQGECGASASASATPEVERSTDRDHDGFETVSVAPARKPPLQGFPKLSGNIVRHDQSRDDTTLRLIVLDCGQVHPSHDPDNVFVDFNIRAAGKQARHYDRLGERGFWFALAHHPTRDGRA